MRCTPTTYEASTRRRNGIINVAAFGMLVALFGSMAMANDGSASDTPTTAESAGATIDAHDEPQMMAMEAIGPIVQMMTPAPAG